jgi:phospholipid/cholesterol/gamma-HCH transport system substrate-binding protein
MTRSQHKGFAGHLTTVVIAAVIAASFGLFYLSVGGGLPSLGGDTYTLRAVLPTAASLASGARVTMSGVDVGRVTAVRRDGVGAIVELRISDKSVTPIPANSRVALRLRTAVGENYVEITPGRSKQTLAANAIVPIDQSDEYVDVDKILSTLQGDTSTRARHMLQGLGGGLEGNGTALNRMVAGTAGVVDNGASFFRVLGPRKNEVGDLVQQVSDLAAAVSDRGQSIDLLARQSNATFRAIADRSGSLRKLIAQLPATLASVRRTTRTVGDVTTTATPVLLNLSRAVRDVRPSVTSLRPAAQQGRQVMRELSVASPRLQTTLSAVRRVSAPTAATLPKLRKTLCELNPMLKYIEPYKADITSLVVGLGAGANSYDAIGNVLTLMPIVGEASLNGLPDSVSAAANTLVHTGLLSKVSGLEYDPYPKPGQIGVRRATGKDVLGPAAFGKTYTYPRIKAEC